MKILIGLLFIPIILMAQISIETAWHNVEIQNDALKASHADVRHSVLKQESAEGMHMPSVSITGSYTRMNDDITLDTSELTGFFAALPNSIPFPSEISFLDQSVGLVDLEVLYPLYMGGKIDAAQDAYAGKTAEAKARHKMAKDKAFLELVKLYYGVVMTRSLHKTRKEAEKAFYMHYMHAKKLKADGQISRAEVLNAQVKLDIAKIETMKAAHKVDIVTSAFYKMIKSKNKPSSSLFVSNKIGSQYSYREKSVENYAAMDVLDAKSKQTSALINVEKAAWYPEVVSFATVNLYDKVESPFNNTPPQWMVGVGVKFDIFSRKDRAKEIEAAKVLHSKVASLTAQAKDDLRLAVQKTYNEILLYKDEFDSLSSSMALARENYKLRNLAFKEGLATSVEVADAQMLLSGAKTQRLNAPYNYVKKLSELCVLSGDKALFFKFEKSAKRIK